MGAVLAGGLEASVELIPRLQRLLVESDVPLRRESLAGAVAIAARTHAPLASAGELEAVVDGLVGLGPIEPLLRDPAVTDIFVNGHRDVWVDRHGELGRVDLEFASPDAVLAAVQRVISPLGLRLDTASPIVDARLADGSRLHAAIPPVALDGPVVAVRRFTAAASSLDALVTRGAMSSDAAAYLRRAVHERRNLLVCGGTGAGKTTLLNVLSREIPASERIVTIEDAAELQLAGHVVRLEARPANAEGLGA
ncbi:MAG: ATPase, T2SS/T4P/T4SS family, partial [Acidimicrobiia bacterium]|nr:ATPase, T2SS/T4P/T4SS family [Acidimicrobiia bacterium]